MIDVRIWVLLHILRVHGQNLTTFLYSLSLTRSMSAYEGHSRINDNEFISRKVLLELLFIVMSYEDTYITYLCLKFGAFIMASFDAMII